MVGNKPNYEKEDIVRVFLSIANPISRSEIVKKTNLGEGTVRTILDILKERNLITSNNKGHVLSETGESKMKKFLKVFEGPKPIKLQTYKGMKSSAILVKQPGNKRIGFEQRDEAIRKGAYSAIIFRHDKELTVPSAEVNYKNEYRADYDTIMNAFEFKKNDILIVAFSKDRSICENSAIAVADKIKRISLL